MKPWPLKPGGEEEALGAGTRAEDRLPVRRDVVGAAREDREVGVLERGQQLADSRLHVARQLRRAVVGIPGRRQIARQHPAVAELLGREQRSPDTTSGSSSRSQWDR